MKARMSLTILCLAVIGSIAAPAHGSDCGTLVSAADGLCDAYCEAMDGTPRATSTPVSRSSTPT